MLHSPLLQLTKNRRHLGHLKLSFYYSTFITNNEVKNENALVFQKPAKYRQRRDFHSNLSHHFLITAADPSRSLQMTINRFPHYDTLPSVVILSGDKNAL